MTQIKFAITLKAVTVMNKKYVVIFAAVIVLLIGFVVMVIFQDKPDTTTQQKVIVNTPHSITPSPSGAVPTLALPPLTGSAKQVAVQFYKYYTTAPENPFANGAYKSSPYLSPEFQMVVSAGNGNVPVFCSQNIRKNVSASQERTYYYGNMYLSQEVLSDATTSKDLFRVVLENKDGKWLIFDINCIN